MGPAMLRGAAVDGKGQDSGAPGLRPKCTQGHPSPPPTSPPAVPHGTQNTIRIYISQQMEEGIYNNLITKMRLSHVLCTQGHHTHSGLNKIRLLLI